MKKKKLKKRLRNNWVVIGLGNPGPKYSETRHNVGFQVIELLKEQLNLSVKSPFFQNLNWASYAQEENNLVLITPQTFMNRSGLVLSWIGRRFSPAENNFLVVVDNMDLPPGEIRIKKGKSSAGHNGLKSLIHHFGRADFYRLYIGVGKPVNQSVVDHVLGIPDSEEQKLIKMAVQRSAELLKMIPLKGFDEVRLECNRK